MTVDEYRAAVRSVVCPCGASAGGDCFQLSNDRRPTSRKIDYVHDDRCLIYHQQVVQDAGDVNLRMANTLAQVTGEHREQAEIERTLMRLIGQVDLDERLSGYWVDKLTAGTWHPDELRAWLKRMLDSGWPE